jgi:DNA-binding NarL/FixJ family response regulator
MIHIASNHLKGGQFTVPKALLVEDSTIFRKLLKETLHSGFPSLEISEAIDGEEAMQEIDAQPPDLIFMDIKLPGENGLELTAKIKARYPEVIVIILTSYDTPEYRQAAVQAKADHFLSKGSSSKEGILALVESIWAGRWSPTGKAHGS